jgi:uncharacterized protein YdhG (YjbR/CyaY superfamily)
MAQAPPGTIDDYISGFPQEVAEVLSRIRSTIRSVAPGAVETMRYGMPTFRLNRDIVHFGAFKHHIGLYPPVRDPELASRIAPYRGEKGNLRFRLDHPIPYELIADIVSARARRER